MKGKFKNIQVNNEKGSTIIEATIVFPIMFLILFFLIYMGNAYYQMAQVESIVEKNAIRGASYCADPILQTIKEEGGLPSVSDIDIQPYRYLFGGASAVESKICTDVKKTIEDGSVSFFKNMYPEVITPTHNIANFNNYVVYSTFSVEVEYQIKFPISFLGKSLPPILVINARSEAPVNDTTEFIRNTDMVIHMFHGTELGKNISDAFGKINDFISSFANK